MDDITLKFKQFALDNGADLVGVAPVARFEGAPAGHRPEDILPGARSVVACAQSIPAGSLDGPATAYHRTMGLVHTQLDLLAYQIARFLETTGGRAVLIPSNGPYRHWEEEKSYGRGDLSHRHAAQAAGLGRLGKNTLLITPQFGNLVHLVSVVTDVELSPDPMMDWEPCPKGCTRCIEACPARAIGDAQRVDQALCRPVIMERLPRGTLIESCRACRRACPSNARRKERNISR